MKKIVILGTENSHAWGFASLLAKGTYPDIRLVGYYGDETGNTAIRSSAGFDCVMSDYNDLVGKVDGIMVTARHGANHLKYALEYIKTGIPVWLDKPLTASVSDTRELGELLEKYRNPFCGGSMLGLVDDTLAARDFVKNPEGSVCGGAVSAPVNMVNPYGNFWFYTAHLAQIMLTTFGDNVKSVIARKNNKGVSAIYCYDDFDVTAAFGADYSVSVYTDKTVFHRHISLDNGTERELAEFHDILTGGDNPHTFAALSRHVFVIDATIRAFESGKETAVDSL